MSAPSRTMSVPARSGMCVSARALVRLKRGSTWMTLAPRLFASMTHWKPTGWASAKLEPWMTMQSLCRRSWRNVVAPPRPKEVPSPETVELWQTRAWFSTCTTPSAVRNFLMR
ncbi:hypothetical protein GA0115246_112863 [Streptomyces sp. SolWspMP-sol7th]|nr:hypothetical protein GA0115246_112863 [Streptomyces sp. SolWspMP-sol7th]